MIIHVNVVIQNLLFSFEIKRMEESYGVYSPFFMGWFPNALGCFLTSQKIKENEYHLFSSLNEQQRLLIMIEFINVDSY